MQGDHHRALPPRRLCASRRGFPQVRRLEAALELSTARPAMAAEAAAERERGLQVASRAAAAREAVLLAQLAVACGGGGGAAKPAAATQAVGAASGSG